MAAIFERCKGGLIQSLVPEFTPGMKVRLISTAFVDRIATVELLDDKGRVQVLLDLLGQALPMRVSPDAIEPFAA
jgi:transcription antitermination factor NusG